MPENVVKSGENFIFFSYFFVVQILHHSLDYVPLMQR